MSVSPFRDPELGRVFERALAGEVRPFFDRLARLSGLPGVRHNDRLAESFAELCGARGAAVDPLLRTMTELSADMAEGGTGFEFVPVCGVLGWGARGATDDAARARALGALHVAADDLRFRVRNAVVDALANVGQRAGSGLLEELSPWVEDGSYFQAAAALRALARPSFCDRLSDAESAAAFLGRAFDLANGAPRSASRYPGHKALYEALLEAAVPLALRFGIAILDEVTRWAKSKPNEMRALAISVAKDKKLAGRFQTACANVLATAKAHDKAPRDGKKVDLPTRKRGGRGTRR